MDEYGLLIGIDWASKAHEICVVTRDGTVVEQCAVKHSAEAVNEFLQRVLQRAGGDPERIAVGIEVPHGALVETMLDFGVHVYALSPKQLDRFRDRHSLAGAKDDRLDAFVLADALRTDLHKFRRVEIDHPIILQIRELGRACDEVREERTRLANRLRDQIYRFASPLLELSTSADDPWFWDLVERLSAPRPRPVTRTQAEKILRKYRIRRLQADDVLAALRPASIPARTGSRRSRPCSQPPPAPAPARRSRTVEELREAARSPGRRLRV